MGSPIRRPSETMRLIMSTFVGVVVGFFLGISFPTISLTKMNLPSNIFPAIDLTYIEDKYSGLSTQAFLNAWTTLKSGRHNDTKIWIPTNPRGAERLPPDIIESQSDYYLRRLWGIPSEFSENFTILLFHYDGRTSEWEEFEWSKRAIHVSARKQTKWWFAKRFLHPDIVAAYDHIFIWDEDLGLDNFDAEEYIKLVRKHGLEISQPGLEANGGLTWEMTKKRDDSEVHKKAEERNGWCGDPHLPPCAAFVEIMAPVFSRDAWRCVWYMIQNDLIHGWGLDFALRKCVEPAHEKIGVIDEQWIVHQGVPSLGNQGKSAAGRAPWEGVRERCNREWAIFQDRLKNAEKTYLEAVGIDASTLESDNQKNIME
ncbi:hypothetical protein JRO89_XS01G0231700 [Xanthoceras sorbifolium]|uniref:Uncharacterized protein n=1 Tax=Xanthoceras sorbifolium TaxID=99658 RepID=A0ABQ8ILB7_9ROSI|nr:hypothetical protein JRO89_XS01G0231700 [Xanthoceras sorbifolium]